MSTRRLALAILAMLVLVCPLAPAAEPPSQPSKVYVPYEDLRGVFEREGQGVFLPYAEFERLWRAAQADPAPPAGQAAPLPYLISTARFTGRVAAELATMQMQLTVDVLSDDWVEVPLGLSEAAVVEASVEEAAGKSPALLRVVEGRYVLLTRGKAQRTVIIDFVRQLQTREGLNVLAFSTPTAAITTLELLIGEENMKVDVKPMLAATTSQVADGGGKATRLQAFLGSAGSVELSWQPKAQAAENIAPIIIAEQLQHIHVEEALVRHDVGFHYDIRGRGVSTLTIQLPGGFRVTAVDGQNISKWDIAAAADDPSEPQTLTVELFSPVSGQYDLSVKMMRFLKETQVDLPLTPIVTREALRETGLIGITHAPRRSAELRDGRNLPRVDTGRLSEQVRQQGEALAFRFISADYGGSMAIGTVDPRLKVEQHWALGVFTDRMELRGLLGYEIDRAGVFDVRISLAEPWEVVSLGPEDLVDDHEFVGSGAERQLRILLKREVTGAASFELVCRAPRAAADEPVSFSLPQPQAENIQRYSGQVVLQLAEQLRAEVDKVQQLQARSLNDLPMPVRVEQLQPLMAFEFKAIDRSVPAGVQLRIAPKPSQVSAVVHRFVNIQPGAVEQEAVVQYRVMYAPVDTFYMKLPVEMVDAGVEISGPNIKEKPRIAALPEDQQEQPGRTAATQPATAPAAAPATAPATGPATQGAGERWAYYKVVVQSPVVGQYQLRVSLRRTLPAAIGDEPAEVQVLPILAAGRLADQSGTIAIAKADTLAIGQPTVRENLEDADPSSPADLPYEPHRRSAVLAFKYAPPPFELTVPVVVQQEAAVFTTLASAAVVEQVLGRDGTLSGRVSYSLLTSRGDRLAIRLPGGAKLFAVTIDGVEAPVEASAEENQRLVRLPPTAGQTARFLLEITYGLDQASASSLAAPSLSDDIPVQQTLWRVWVPEETVLLGFDRDFAALTPRQAEAALYAIDSPQPPQFKLPPQGRCWDFVRQGPPATLSLLLANRQWFAIVLWAAILAGGAALLWVSPWRRCLCVLGLAVALAVVRLFEPLLAGQIVRQGTLAAIIVLALWAARGLLRSFGRRSRPAPVPAPAPQADSTTQDKE